MLALGIWWIDSIPAGQGELRGHVGYFVSGATGVLAFLAGVYWVNQFVALGPSPSSATTPLRATTRRRPARASSHSW